MSQVPSTSTSTTSFEAIFAAALKEYKKQTKRDIASHPLAAQLQCCDSPSAILTVLQARVQKFDQSQIANEKWIKWMDPTVNVLFAFSATLGNSVGLVIARHSAARELRSNLWDFRYSHPQTRYSPESGYFSK
jgi:hypothetical protein